MQFPLDRPRTCTCYIAHDSCVGEYSKTHNKFFAPLLGSCFIFLFEILFYFICLCMSNIYIYIVFGVFLQFLVNFHPCQAAQAHISMLKRTQA